MLPTMLAAAQKFSNYSIKLLLAPSISERMIAPLVNNHNVELLRGEPFAHMLKMQAGIVKSGTSTLEAAIAFMPQVVVYKGNALSIWIAKKLVGGKIKFISLVNLVMNKMVVKELIQEQASAAAIEKELSPILANEQYRLNMLANYQGLKNILGKGKASVNVANIIMDELDEVHLDI
jgi:lipid-A-disaccharide synthase